jgi:L-lactate dehydrogenase
MGLGEVSLSLPAIINRDGVARVLSIPLSPSERPALERSAALLKEQIALLDSSFSAPDSKPEIFHHQI